MNISEAVARLENVPGHEWPELKLVLAELKRLTAPVAPTYSEACAEACEGCRENWRITFDESTHLVSGGDGTSAPIVTAPCTAPIEREYWERRGWKLEEDLREFKNLSSELAEHLNAAKERIRELEQKLNCVFNGSVIDMD